MLGREVVLCSLQQQDQDVVTMALIVSMDVKLPLKEYNLPLEQQTLESGRCTHGVLLSSAAPQVLFATNRGGCLPR